MDSENGDKIRTHEMTPKRIKRERTRGWKMPPNTKSVCRPGRWGNPFKVGYPNPLSAKGEPMTVETAIANYEKAIEYRSLRDAIKRELRGFNLACYCRLDRACHADVLLRIANEEEGENNR